MGPSKGGRARGSLPTSTRSAPRPAYFLPTHRPKRKVEKAVTATCQHDIVPVVYDAFRPTCTPRVKLMYGRW